MKIAFIGLGRMGRPMVENLLKAGHSLAVHNRSRSVVEAFVQQGAKAAGSPGEAVQQADIVMSCLLNPEQVREVYFGSNGIVDSIAPGQLVIDFATVEPALSRELGDAIVKKGGRFLDAPVSGGPTGAAAATLTVMVGGEAEDFTVAKPIFECVGTNIFHMGPIGAGTSTKVCNQILTGVNHVLVCEAMVLGTKAGIDPSALFEVLRRSSGRSNALERAVPNFILSRNFNSPAFVVEGIIKDLECAIRTAKALGVRLMLASVAQQMFIETAALGHAQDDVSSVILPMEEIAGVTVMNRSGKGPKEDSAR
ncbi:MAG: 2-hydroxy-3-oxopropionate reductase [Pseudolabrys sp.]|jgi:3-hydroxyisobutyrate dehydrogenase|nr:2-hydroxy-3-oxopropionate reductase [Pseudolabrys sp.]